MTQIRDALELLTAQHEEIDELCDRVARARDAVTFGELADKVARHLAGEQELFYPAVADQLSPDVRSELCAEHLEIKRLLARLVWLGVDDEEFPRLFAQLDELLLGHAAWQDDALFMCVAETVSLDRLAERGDQLHALGGVVAVAA